MEPPEGCPPLAGRKGHACHSPPRPVFCPDRPRPLDLSRAAKPHYTVPDRAELPSLPGRGTRGGVADTSPVRQPAGSSRRMPRFGPQVREVPRRRALAPRKFGLEPELPLPSGHAHSPRAVPQNPSAQCPIGLAHKACRGSSHKRGALPPLLWGAPSGCRGISRASRLREKAASGGVLVWNPKRRAPLRKAQAPIRLVWGQTDAALEPKTPRIFEKAAHLQGYCAAALEKPPLRRFMRAGVAFWANGPSAGAAWFSFRGGENKL